MKYEWRRQEKQLYGAKTTPVLVTVPTQSCIMINGEGNPNDTDFSNRVSALYSVAYAVKMAYKKTAKGEYDDFAVYPLEGVWQKIENCELIKEKLRYTLVIRQPDFVGEDGVCAALERTKHRKPNPLLEEVCFGTVPGETCVQLLHVGAYDDEPVSRKNGRICTRPQPDAHGGRPPGNLPEQCHPHRKKQAQNHFAL